MKNGVKRVIAIVVSIVLVGTVAVKINLKKEHREDLFYMNH